MPTYRVHKPIALHKANSKIKKELMVEGAIERDYMWQPKYDGVCAIIQQSTASTRSAVVSREGHALPSVQAQAEDLIRHWDNRCATPSVLFAEVWRPGESFSTISGEARRLSPQPQLRLAVWDCVARHAYVGGKDYTDFAMRHRRLMSVLSPAGVDSESFFGVPALSFHAPVLATRDRFLEEHPLGFDGIVAKAAAGIWVRGAGTGGEMLKFKKSLDFDLRVKGIVIATSGKYLGGVGALVVEFEGNDLEVGTGLSDIQRWTWATNPGEIVGKIVEVEAMSRSSKGLLREPRLKGVRYDLS